MGKQELGSKNGATPPDCDLPPTVTDQVAKCKQVVLPAP